MRPLNTCLCLSALRSFQHPLTWLRSSTATRCRQPQIFQVEFALQTPSCVKNIQLTLNQPQISSVAPTDSTDSQSVAAAAALPLAAETDP